MPDCKISSLHLDYGADAQHCADDGLIDVTERGMRMKCRWNFALGTQLSIAFVGKPANGESGRIEIEGTVVWCEPAEVDEAGQSLFESTLLFLDLPDDCRDTFRDMCTRLAIAKAHRSQELG